jgi:hypothetical protein
MSSCRRQRRSSTQPSIRAAQVRRRDRGIDDRSVRQPRRPGVEFLAVGDSERQVVQAGTALHNRGWARALCARSAAVVVPPALWAAAAALGGDSTLRKPCPGDSSAQRGRDTALARSNAVIVQMMGRVRETTKGMIPSDGIIDPDTGAAGTGYHALSRSMGGGDSRSCIRRQSDVPFLEAMPDYGDGAGRHPCFLRSAGGAMADERLTWDNTRE